MSISKTHRKEIEATVLDMVHEDHLIAEFYLHEAIDPNNETIIEAQRLANEEALRKSNIQGKPIEPDYTPENLIRLGAKQKKNKFPYVKITRLGSRDYRSSLVDEDHKKAFPEQWAKFKELNHEYFEDLRKRRDNIRTETDRPAVNKTSTDWQGGGVSYTPTPYTISFG